MRKKNSSNCPEKAKIGGIDYQKYNDEGTKFCRDYTKSPVHGVQFLRRIPWAIEKTELGRMKKILPLREMAESLKLVN